MTPPHLAPIHFDGSSYAPMADITLSRLFFPESFGKMDGGAQSDILCHDDFQCDMFQQLPAICHTETEPLAAHDLDDFDLDEYLSSSPIDLGQSDPQLTELEELGELDSYSAENCNAEGYKTEGYKTESCSALSHSVPSHNAPSHNALSHSAPSHNTPSIATPLEVTRELEKEHIAQCDQLFKALDGLATEVFYSAWTSSPSLRARSYWWRRDLTRCITKGCQLPVKSNLELCLHLQTHTLEEREYRHKSKQGATLYCMESDCHYNYIGFTSEGALARHRRQLHDTTHQGAQCRFCQRTFKRADGAKRHEMYQVCRRTPTRKPKPSKGAACKGAAIKLEDDLKDAEAAPTPRKRGRLQARKQRA